MTAIREARERLGWTQRELARRCGLSQAHISRIEGPYSNIPLHTLLAVLAAMDMQLVVEQRIGPTLYRREVTT